MSLVNPQRGQSIVQTLAEISASVNEAATLGRQAANFVNRVRNNLPDIRKERNQFQSTFQRKMAPQNKSGIVGNRNVNQMLIDRGTASSTKGQANRSMTNSRQIGVSNGSGRGGGGRRRARMSVPRSPYLDTINVCFRGNYDITNTSTNIASVQIALAINTPLGVVQLGAVMPQIAALAGIFREWRLKKLDVEFIPRVSSTITGAIAACVDRDPRAGTVVSSSTVIRKDPFFECDLKQGASLTWKPLDNEDKRYRYTTDVSRPQEFLSHGVLLAYSGNSLGTGVSIGELFLDGWFEFAIPL